VWGRAQTHNLGPQRDQAVVFVVGNVAEGDVDGQSGLALDVAATLRTSNTQAK
jgi:hypothetical protein